MIYRRAWKARLSSFILKLTKKLVDLHARCRKLAEIPFRSNSMLIKLEMPLILAYTIWSITLKRHLRTNCFWQHSFGSFTDAAVAIHFIKQSSYNKSSKGTYLWTAANLRLPTHRQGSDAKNSNVSPRAQVWGWRNCWQS